MSKICNLKEIIYYNYKKELFCKVLFRTSKKLVLILMTSTPIIEISKKKDIFLNKILRIHYPLLFWKDIVEIKTLINSGSKINTMTGVYILKLGFKVWYINVKAQKINGSILKMIKIVLAIFYMENKLKKACFFFKKLFY